MIPTIPKKYIKLVFHIFWPFIWPLRPSLAFFNFFEVLEVLEVQWHALVTYQTLLSSESIIVENFPFLTTVDGHPISTKQIITSFQMCWFAVVQNKSLKFDPQLKYASIIIAIVAFASRQWDHP